MQMLRSKTSQLYQQLQKNINFVSIIFCKGRHDQPRLLHLIYLLMMKFFLSAAIQVPHKSSNTIHPSPHASITCILTTKQSDSKSAHTDRGLDSCWSGCGGFSHILKMEEATSRTDRMALTGVWVRAQGRNEDPVDSMTSLEARGSLISRHIQNGESR